MASDPADIDDDHAVARAAQDGRVRFSAPPELPATVRDGVVAAVREHVGWPELAVSQDEAIVVDELVATPTGWQARLAYTLDRDFCSQYDQRDTITGVCTIEHGGTVSDVRWDPLPSAPSL